MRLRERAQASSCAAPARTACHAAARLPADASDVSPGGARALAQRFTVICADLRGHARSGCLPSDPGHAPYAKRAMADEMVAVMERLGFPRFSAAGHNRGGRVAYRLALDHPERVERLAVLDILPVAEVWEPADKRLATTYWPWSLLAQHEPLPERLVGKTVRRAILKGESRCASWLQAPRARSEAVLCHGSSPGGIRSQGSRGLLRKLRR